MLIPFVPTQTVQSVVSITEKTIKYVEENSEWQYRLLYSYILSNVKMKITYLIFTYTKVFPLIKP